MNQKGKRHLQQLGFSLLETLIALSLISMLCLILMRLQLHLFHDIRRLQTQHATIRSKISLTESLHSCQGDSQCEQQETQRLQNTQPFTTEKNHLMK